MSDGAPNPIPLRLGTDEEFAALRSALVAAAYNEPAICDRLDIQRISQFPFATENRPPARILSEHPDTLDLLIRLFLENLSVERDPARALPLDSGRWSGPRSSSPTSTR